MLCLRMRPTVLILAVLVCLPLLVNGSYFFFLSRFCLSLGREVFGFRLYTKSSKNLCLTGIDFMCTYLSWCTEGLNLYNLYLSIKKFTSTALDKKT